MSKNPGLSIEKVRDISVHDAAAVRPLPTDHGVMIITEPDGDTGNEIMWYAEVVSFADGREAEVGLGVSITPEMRGTPAVCQARNDLIQSAWQFRELARLGVYHLKGEAA